MSRNRLDVFYNNPIMKNMRFLYIIHDLSSFANMFLDVISSILKALKYIICKRLIFSAV